MAHTKMRTMSVAEIYILRWSANQIMSKISPPPPGDGVSTPPSTFAYIGRDPTSLVVEVSELLKAANVPDYTQHS